MPLFDTTLRNTRAGEKPLKLSDGGGLYILVKTSGKKFWHMAYRFDGKQKLLSFGQYPESASAMPVKPGRKRVSFWQKASTPVR